MATINSSSTVSPNKTESRKGNKFYGEGLTFDDVLLMPGYSRYITTGWNIIQSRLTKNITLNIPLLSAAMDTVTESSLAMVRKRERRPVKVHKNMTVEEQSEQVRKVKRSESGVDP